jgi:mitochondrial fission protein ELM1
MSRFDLVLLPHHDNISGRAPHNVLRIDGAVTHIKPESLEQAAQRWVADWSRLPECKIAVLVGGDTSKHKIGRGDIVELMGHCERIATATNGCLMVTNSRRTSAEANQALVQCLSELQVPYYCYDCNTGGDNPYMGLLAHSSYIVTTGDSISMCAESVASGKPTFIYAKKEGVGKKHWRFIEKLIALGRAKLLKNFAPGMIMVDQQASNELKQSVIARLHQASKTT